MKPHRRSPARHAQHGNVLLIVLILILVCGAIAASVLLPALFRHRETEAASRRMHAFQMAETGIELAISAVRENDGVAPGSGIASTSVQGSGSYQVTYTPGTANGVDDDGDGVVDESDESDYVIITSVGEAGSQSRAVRAVTRRVTDLPTITAAITVNVPAPVIDVKGNRFIVDGRDHALDATLDPYSAALYALATPAAVADINAQLSPLVVDQFLGLTASPSITQTPLFDLDALALESVTAATVELQPGSHANKNLGTPTASGVEVVVCEGDLHLSGNSSGAGVLIVTGNLAITGNFTWTGLVLVRGSLRMSGGGHTKKVVGGVMIGEEIQSIDTDLTLTGTVDLLYSSEAIDLATSTMAATNVIAWYEVAAP